MKKIYFFITIAVLLFVFNLTQIDFENLFNEDSKIGLTGALACACTILLLIILYVSKKINNKQN
jgi:multisubunit Na+/H+ antiporter MnhB subunit|tara:strand:+ start:152 stop:343 length:192 start_codon:yes stop_codon:yes gene_type:complete